MVARAMVMAPREQKPVMTPRDGWASRARFRVLREQKPVVDSKAVASAHLHLAFAVHGAATPNANALDLKA